MKELIKVIRNRIGEDEVNSVDARELHGFLEVKTRFDKWFERRVSEYGFIKNSDFCPILTESSGGRPATEYIITIDMAKELSMVERNAKGKEARQYFIQRDKQLSKIQSDKVALPDFTNPAEAAMAWEVRSKVRSLDFNCPQPSSHRSQLRTGSLKMLWKEFV